MLLLNYILNRNFGNLPVGISLQLNVTKNAWLVLSCLIDLKYFKFISLKYVLIP